jgi:hypothetical protein
MMMQGQTMKEQLSRLRAQLGSAGLLALGLIGLAFALNLLVVQPLQAKKAALGSALSARQAQSPGQPVARPGEKLAGVYRHLERDEATTDWLAKLYAIGKATGVAVQSGSYRPAPPAEGGPGRIERYEIVLPVGGTYPQLRDFLGRALAEIPVLSLDQLSLKREGRGAAEVQAELKMTLHMVKQ